MLIQPEDITASGYPLKDIQCRIVVDASSPGIFSRVGNVRPQVSLKSCIAYNSFNNNNNNNNEFNARFVFR